MATKERVYRMSLKDFDRYLNDKRDELEACYREIEEVRAQLEAIFKRELAAWQERFGFCYPRVLEGRREMPAAFAQLIARTEEEERARIRAEITQLENEIREQRAKMDDELAQAQAAIEALRTANPDLNAREEKLKALVVKHQDEYARAYEQMEALQRPFLGGLANAGKIGQLKKAQRSAKGKQAKLLGQLRQVRQEWLDDVQKAGDTQAELRQQWEQAGVRASEAQTRHDHLQAHLEALAEQAAIQRVLEELSAPPEVPGELGAALKDLAERNQVRRAYEEALRAVSMAAGLTKGVGGGLTTFAASVRKVWDEQRRYNLKDVKVPLPESAAKMNEIWKDLEAKVKDDKYLGTHPSEFSRLVDEYVKARLTDEAIKDLFESMGDALNQATKAWG